MKIKINYSAGKLAKALKKDMIGKAVNSYALGTQKGSRNNIFQGKVKPDISEKTKDAREQRGLLRSPPLLATGTLFNSIKVKPLKTKANLTMKEYGYFHHVGEGKNRERPFIEAEEGTFNEILKQFKADLIKNIIKQMIFVEDILIPEEVYDEICIIMDCEYIDFMGIA